MLNQWDWNIYRFGMSVQGKLEGMKLTRFNGTELPDFLSKIPPAGLDIASGSGFPKRCTITYELHEKPKQPLSGKGIVDAYADADWPEYAVLNGTLGNWIPDNGFIQGLPIFHYYGNQLIQGWLFADSKDRTWWVAPKLDYDRLSRTLTIELEAQLFGIISDKSLPEGKIELNYQKKLFTFPVDCMGTHNFRINDDLGMQDLGCISRSRAVAPTVDWMAFPIGLGSLAGWNNAEENPYWVDPFKESDGYFDLWVALYGDISKSGERATISIRARPKQLQMNALTGWRRDTGVHPHRNYITHGWYELKITELNNVLDISIETISDKAWNFWFETWGQRLSEESRTEKTKTELFHVMYDENDVRVEMMHKIEEQIFSLADDLQFRQNGTVTILRNNVAVVTHTYTTDRQGGNGIISSSISGEVWRGKCLLAFLAEDMMYAMPCALFQGAETGDISEFRPRGQIYCGAETSMYPLHAYIETFETGRTAQHVLGVEVLGNKLVAILECTGLVAYGRSLSASYEGPIVYPEGGTNHLVYVNDSDQHMGENTVYFPKTYAGVITPEGDILPYNPKVEFERVTMQTKYLWGASGSGSRWDQYQSSVTFDRQKITQSVRWHPKRKELIYMDDDGEAESLQIV